MRRFRNILFLLAALLWLPASVHCQIEAASGFEFLSCHADNGASHDASDDCTQCCSVEKASYRLDNAKLSIPAPQLLPVILASIIDLQPAAPSEQNTGIITAAPPELPQTWHFIARTALPVRAPSLLS